MARTIVWLLPWLSWMTRLHTIMTADLPCSFAVDKFEFDLCPLIRSQESGPIRISLEEETPPTRTQNVYMIGLGGALTWDHTLPAELQCREGTWICLTVINTRPSHPSEPSRILQVVPIAGTPGLDPKARLDKKDNENDPHAPLQLTLHGGRYMKQSQKASFQFLCDHQAEDPTKPEFLWSWNGTHSFSWKTKHACPKSTNKSPPPEPSDTDPPSKPPADPEGEHGETPQGKQSLSLFSIILWMLFPTLVLLRLLYPFLKRRRFGLLSHISLPFYKVGLLSSRSLHWTYNGARTQGLRDRHHEMGEFYEPIAGEDVPLTPSPRVEPGNPKITGKYGSIENLP